MVYLEKTVIPFIMINIYAAGTSGRTCRASFLNEYMEKEAHNERIQQVCNAVKS